MSKFIAILRGINVGGHKKIKMADLRELLEKAGLKDVQTYIQSGNVVFSSTEKNRLKLARTIETAIEKSYGFHVPTLVTTHEYLVSVRDNNPFILDTSKETKKMYFTFLYSLPVQENCESFCESLLSYTFTNEEIIIDKTMLYMYYGNGAGKSKITGNFIENKLKVTMSSRNYNTLLKLIEMSKPQ